MVDRIRKILVSKTAGNVALAVLSVLGVYFFFYEGARFFRIPSSSMEQTLFPADMIVTTSESEYRRGDIVVLREPESPGDFFVKRIVGVGGDLISVSGGALLINGQYASEPYTVEPMAYEIVKPVLIPEGTVFVLGDNRNVSSDSHDESECFGVDTIVGRVRFIYYPYDRFGPVHSYPLTNLLGQ